MDVLARPPSAANLIIRLTGKLSSAHAAAAANSRYVILDSKDKFRLDHDSRI